MLSYLTAEEGSCTSHHACSFALCLSSPLARSCYMQADALESEASMHRTAGVCLSTLFLSRLMKKQDVEAVQRIRNSLFR